MPGPKRTFSCVSGGMSRNRRMMPLTAALDCTAVFTLRAQLCTSLSRLVDAWLCAR